MTRAGKGLTSRREDLQGIARQLQQQRQADKGRLATMAIGRPFTPPLAKPINDALRDFGIAPVYYETSGYIGLQYLRRSDMAAVVEAGHDTLGSVDHAIRRVGHDASSRITVSRGAVGIARERPVINNARRSKFWLVAPVVQMAVSYEAPGTTIDIASEQAKLCDALEIPHPGNEQLLWLGTLVAPNLGQAESALAVLEAQLAQQIVAEPLQPMKTVKH